MVVAVIVDIRAADMPEAATTFFDPIRNGFASIFNLQGTSLENEESLSLIVCRSHPDDCEKILSPPYTIHTAYEAIQWFSADLDSEMFESTPIDPQISIERSFQCCDDENPSHIILISHHHDRDTLSAITRSIRHDHALTFYAICASYEEDRDRLKGFETELQSELCSRQLKLLSPGPDVWESVFSDIRGLLIQPQTCNLDLSGLLKGHFISETKFLLRNVLENLALPRVKKVCSCHGRKPSEFDPMALSCQAIQIGSNCIPLNTDESELLETHYNRLLMGKCFVKVEDVCESKLTGPIFVGWQDQSDELFEALRYYMTKRKLALISEGQLETEGPIPLSRRYIMTFTNECGNQLDKNSYGFLLMRELISKDAILVSWRTKTITEKQIRPDTSERNISFGKCIEDVSSVLIHSRFHEQMKTLVASSAPFRSSAAP